MIETRYTLKSIRPDRIVVGYRFDGMPVNAAGDIVLTPLMRLEGYREMDDGQIAKRTSSPDTSATR